MIHVLSYFTLAHTSLSRCSSAACPVGARGFSHRSERVWVGVAYARHLLLFFDKSYQMVPMVLVGLASILYNTSIQPTANAHIL